MPKPSSASGPKPSALVLCPEAPYPVIGGGPLRTASLIEYLAQRYAIHAIVFREPGSPDPARAVPPGRIEKLDVLELPHHSKQPLARALRNSMRLVRNTPPLMDRFSGFAATLSELVSSNRYDVAILEHFWCAPYLEQIRPHARRVILDLHNVESHWHESLAGSEGGARSFALRRFAAAARGLESRWLPGFDSLLVTSKQEAGRVRRVVAHPDITVYPNALPLIPAPAPLKRSGLVFSGNLEYPPNIAAIRFFRDSIWPELRARSGLIWRIVGKNPDVIRSLVHGDPRIEVTGFVEDAVDAIASAEIAVVPVLSGSGTRIKILEAWAAGTPVVSTPVGAEGLDYQDGQELLIAEQPSRFVDAVSRLLDAPDERARIGSAGRRLYEQRYNWPVAWQAIQSIFGN
jgi:glycosyltransferase involved in cell wall biosynthesis